MSEEKKKSGRMMRLDAIVEAFFKLDGRATVDELVNEIHSQELKKIANEELREARFLSYKKAIQGAMADFIELMAAKGLIVANKKKHYFLGDVADLANEANKAIIRAKGHIGKKSKIMDMVLAVKPELAKDIEEARECIKRNLHSIEMLFDPDDCAFDEYDASYEYEHDEDSFVAAKESTSMRPDFVKAYATEEIEVNDSL